MSGRATSPGPDVRAASLGPEVRAWLERLPDYRPDRPMVVAVSAGLDSTVLLHLLVEAGANVFVAHVHHGLRGADADADEAFVRCLAESLDKPYARVDLGSEWARNLTGRSRQDAARRLRYDHLAALAEQEGAPFVATGHTRDDQAETVLLHLGRGAGPDGLAGMSAVRPLNSAVRLIRPLLATSRVEIEACASARGLSWREDASNQNLDYRRNALRHDLLPSFARIMGGDVAGRIAHAADLLRAYVDEEQKPLLEALRGLVVSPLKGGAVELALDRLQSLPAAWRARLVLDVVSSVLDRAPRDRVVAARALRLVDSQVGRRLDLPGGAVWRERNSLVVAPTLEKPPARIVDWGATCAVSRPVAVDWGVGEIRCAEVGWPNPEDRAAGRSGNRRLYVDPDRVPGEWELRPWEPGDRITLPDGRLHARVKTVLTDSGIESWRRANEAVLTAAGRVFCLVGHRVDPSVSPDATSRRVFEISRGPAPDPVG